MSNINRINLNGIQPITADQKAKKEKQAQEQEATNKPAPNQPMNPNDVLGFMANQGQFNASINKTMDPATIANIGQSALNVFDQMAEITQKIVEETGLSEEAAMLVTEEYVNGLLA